MIYKKVLLVLLSIFSIISCKAVENNVIPGAYNTEAYINELRNKNIALVVNHSSYINERHLIDTLIQLNINIDKVFAPEHGFFGNAEAGATVRDSVLENIEIISLYGKRNKPTERELSGVDWVVFDIQDVGARFYTYISTLHYIMEACAENKVKLLVLDRPNPLRHYIDGPVLEDTYKSFVGMHPVPIVYGLTIGEYAHMINGEGWLKNKVQCDVTIIPNMNYEENRRYVLPIAPSPNLPNMQSIYLYPSLCLFEGTVVSIGRGTEFPFQVIGHPACTDSLFSFKPVRTPGASLNPKFKDQICYGSDLRRFKVASDINKLKLDFLISYYKVLEKEGSFFVNYFNLLAGNKTLQEQIKQGKSSDEIRRSWQEELDEYKKMRRKYLIYNWQ